MPDASAVNNGVLAPKCAAPEEPCLLQGTACMSEAACVGIQVQNIVMQGLDRYQ